MTKSQAKAIFLWGTLISAVIFLYLSYDSISQIPKRTNEDKLSEKAAAGKWVWQKYNCNNCHTILGIGGYYAPDVTKVMSYRDSDWMRMFLKDPEKVKPTERKMPNLNLTEKEIEDIIEFLKWVNEIDTNNWPPKPMMAAAVGSGEEVYRAQGCSACHAIKGIGGHIGPDLSRVGGLRTKEWLKEQLINPKLHNPDSLMPSYAKLTENERNALVDYLSGLK